VSLVDRWTALRDVPRAELEGRPDATVVPGVGYEGVNGVDRVSTGGLHYFFDGDRCALVYLPRAVVGGTSIAPFIEELGEGETLSTNTEKSSVLRVWADRGLAASVDREGAVELAEVFPETTFENYRERIYKEPQPHRR
jgi:hypothetical protein